MRVAVLSVTRDRLDYTKHCFRRLSELGGHPFDHYVFDNGSQDGTSEWLRSDYAPYCLETSPENVGISRALNVLLNTMDGDYDVVVKFDNDCELAVPGTLSAAAEVASEGLWLASPHIQGLNEPPPVSGEETVAGYRMGVVSLLGGIFLAAPGSLFQRYRHDEGNPIWGMDDVNLCSYWRNTGGHLGYLLDFPANHYLTTEGQKRDNPMYYARKEREFRT